MENFDELVESVVKVLIDKNLHISFAESCTGGMCCAALVGVADASKVLDMSFITYANEAKTELLGVSTETINANGVVSEAVAAEMAAGVANKADSQIGVGITGVAGPGGGTAKKPVGMVCFGFCINKSVTTITKQFGNIGRNNVRRLSVEFVYKTLYGLLTEKGE